MLQWIAIFHFIQQVSRDINSFLVVANNVICWNLIYNILEIAIKLCTYIEIYIQYQIEVDSKLTLVDDCLTADE